METLDPNSLESFITVYGFMCDYYNTQYLEDVSTVSICNVNYMSDTVLIFLYSTYEVSI